MHVWFAAKLVLIPGVENCCLVASWPGHMCFALVKQGDACELQQYIKVFTGHTSGMGKTQETAD